MSLTGVLKTLLTYTQLVVEKGIPKMSWEYLTGSKCVNKQVFTLAFLVVHPFCVYFENRAISNNFHFHTK